MEYLILVLSWLYTGIQSIHQERNICCCHQAKQQGIEIELFRYALYFKCVNSAQCVYKTKIIFSAQPNVGF